MSAISETAAGHYLVRLGARLRETRRALGWTLQDAADISDGIFSEASIGAYERAERSISVARLWLLAELYAVPIAQLLPDTLD